MNVLVGWCSILGISGLSTDIPKHGIDRSLDSFLEAFLQAFPLERVVQIHLAGLGIHPAVNSVEGARIPDSQNWPNWIDSHGEPIPEILFEILDRVLSSPRLVNLKGIALEVDTKPIELILEEYAEFRNRLNWWERRGPSSSLHPQFRESG